MAIDRDRAISQAAVAIRSRAEDLGNFLRPAWSHALQEVGSMVPRTRRRRTGRDSRVHPGEIIPLRQPDLPLIRLVVALRAEHEFMHAIAERYSLEQVMFQS